MLLVRFFLKNQLKARGYCKQLVVHVCSLILEQLRRKGAVPSGALWSVWKLHLAIKLEVVKRQTILGRKQFQERAVLLKHGMEFVLLSVVERNVKQKPEIDLVSLRKTVSLEQVKTFGQRFRTRRREQHGR